MRFLIFLLRLALFVVCTLAFVVLYEHGPKGFASNATTEIQKLCSEVGLIPSSTPPSTP